MSVQLHYFQLRARAEPLRMMLRYSGLEYADVIMPLEEWFLDPSNSAGVPRPGGAKEKMPPGRTGERQLPVLGLPDGTLMPEALDIARYIAERGNPSLLGTDQTKADRLATLGDRTRQERADAGSKLPYLENYNIVNPILNWFSVEESEVQIPTFLTAVPEAMRYLVGELGSGPFFGGEAPDYGDFVVFHYVDNLVTLDGGATLQGLGDAGVGFRAWFDRMRSLPAVAAYLAERPQPGVAAVGRPGSIMATVAQPSELPVVKRALASIG